MATFTKRNGQRGIRWEARVRKLNYPTLTKTFSLKTDAEAWAIETERHLERGSFSSPHLRETLKDILERYAYEVTATKRGAKEEAFRIGKIMRHPIAEMMLSKLKPAHFAKYRDQRLKEVTPTSVIKELVLLNHALDTAQKEWGCYLPVKPLQGIRKPTENPQRDRRLDGEELKRLMASCGESANHWFCPLVITAIETAMR